VVQDFGILIHGGARNQTLVNRSSKQTKDIRRSLELAVSLGYDSLSKENEHINPTAVLDAVEISVATMEDSGLFDAGIRGSYLTAKGEVEMDAAIMSGRDLSAGSVGMVKDIKNPVRVARLVMQYTDHVMLVSEGVTEFGRLFDLKIKHKRPISHTLKYNIYKKNKNKITQKEWPKNSRLFLSTSHFLDYHYGTVGAVAIDRAGNTASAVSTGGRWFKMRGRIGDSAIIGSGLYADNESGAACATGVGEFIMRLCLAKEVCNYMRKDNATTSGKRAVKMLSEKFGKNTGGLITVDKYGRFGVAMNTPSMPIAIFTNHTKKAQVAFSREEATLLSSHIYS
jgi:beta-aspartyl-peptidase (threonine type)